MSQKLIILFLLLSIHCLASADNANLSAIRNQIKGAYASKSVDELSRYYNSDFSLESRGALHFWDSILRQVSNELIIDIDLLAVAHFREYSMAFFKLKAEYKEDGSVVEEVAAVRVKLEKDRWVLDSIPQPYNKVDLINVFSANGVMEKKAEKGKNSP